MARILFTVQPGIGHLNPLTPLTGALQDAGHDVRVATARRFGEVVAARGLTAVPAGLDWRESAVEEAFPGFLRLGTYAQIAVFAGRASPAMAADLITLAHDWRPDLIVRDNLEWGGWVAAVKLGVPSVVYNVTSRLPPARIGLAAASELAALRATHHLPPDPELRTVDGALSLDTTPPSLQVTPGAPLDPGVVSVRPVYGDVGTGGTLPEWLGRSDGRPLVFATLGTVFHGNDALLMKVLAAVADEPYRVLLAGADRPSGVAFPANVHLERYVPLSRTLPSCAAVVSHGGRGTVLTALSQGVPLCLLPLSAEQPANAAVVARAGAGLVCATGEVRIGPFTFPHTDPDRLDPAAIRVSVRRLLGEPGIRDRARAIQAEIAAMPGPRAVVGLLEELLGRGAPARGSMTSTR